VPFSCVLAPVFTVGKGNCEIRKSSARCSLYPYGERFTVKPSHLYIYDVCVYGTFRHFPLDVSAVPCVGLSVSAVTVQMLSRCAAAYFVELKMIEIVYYIGWKAGGAVGCSAFNWGHRVTLQMCVRAATPKIRCGHRPAASAKA